jgi:cell division septation protein DedD
LEADWLYQRAQVHLGLMGFTQALASFEALLKGYPDHAQAASAALGRAECLAALRRDEEAARAFEAIYQAKGAMFAAQALWGAAVQRQRQGRLPEAKALYSRLRAEYPASFEAQAAKERLEAPALAAVPTLAPPPKPKALQRRFSVQVGAYSKPAYAEKHARELRAKKYKVKVEKSRAGSGLFLVKLGSYRNREEAQGMATRYSRRERAACQIVEE